MSAWHTLFCIELDFLEPDTLHFAQDLHRRCRQLAQGYSDLEDRFLTNEARAVLEEDGDYGNRLVIEDHRLTISSDPENVTGDIDQAVAFVQALLRYENSPRQVKTQWATIHEPIRPDGFGGGAVVIHRDKTQWFETGEWLERATKRF